MVVVDSPIWSLALRRRERDLNVAERGHRQELERLLRSGDALLIGAVRQEVLSGVRDELAWARLRAALRRFPDVVVHRDDYERAAQFNNQCRARGVAASPTDLLICAVAARFHLPVYTLDGDFERYADILGIALHEADATG